LGNQPTACREESIFDRPRGAHGSARTSQMSVVAVGVFVQQACGWGANPGKGEGLKIPKVLTKRNAFGESRFPLREAEEVKPYCRIAGWGGSRESHRGKSSRSDRFGGGKGGGTQEKNRF